MGSSRSHARAVNAESTPSAQLPLGIRVFLSVICGVGSNQNFDCSPLPPSVSLSTFRLATDRRDRPRMSVSEFYVVPSIEKPRWIIASDAAQRCRLINPTNAGARLAWFLFRFLQSYGLGRFIFSNRIILDKDIKMFGSNVFGELIQPHDQIVAFYIGAVGPLQKFTIEVRSSDNSTSFIKFGVSERAKSAIRKEVAGLNLISSLGVKVAELPRYQSMNEEFNENKPLAFRQQAVSATELPDQYSLQISDFLVELADLSAAARRPDFDRIRYDLGALVISGELPAKYNRVINKLIGSFDDSEMNVSICLSHGDFTRWNLRESKGKLCIFDWEEVDYRAFGHDLFNFCFAEVVLVAGHTEVEKLLEISKPKFLRLVAETKADRVRADNFSYYFNLFMLDRIRYYYGLKAKDQDGSFFLDKSNKKVFSFLTNWISQLSDNFTDGIDESSLS